MATTELLMKVDLDKVEHIPYKDQVIVARLKNVTDGDTLKVVILIGDYPMELNIRILGIDAPETALRKGVTELEKKAGLLVKNHVKSLFESGKVYKIVLRDNDKYAGRYLGDIYLESGECLSKYLLSKNLVRPYFGDAKKEWDSSFLNNILSYLNRSV